MISRLHERDCRWARGERTACLESPVEGTPAAARRTELHRNDLPGPAVHVRSKLFQARIHLQERPMKPKPVRVRLLLWLSVMLAASLVAVATPAKDTPQAAADQVPEGPTKLLRFADISKDKVVFAYAGDLWIASRE